MQLEYGAATHPGRVRQRNEDTFVASEDLGLFVVADGMGGHAGGQIASQTVADGILEFIQQTVFDPEKTWPLGLDPELSDPANRLQAAIRSANKRLADRVSDDTALDGTGATISAVLVTDGRIVASNVGDCRVYLVRGENVMQLTRDHSYVAEQVARGLIAAEDARKHPMRHIVTRAVSGDAAMIVDVQEVVIAPGDRVLLCSDGIHALVSDEELSAIATATDRSLPDLCQSLVEAANREGGTDNSTAILVSFKKP